MTRSTIVLITMIAIGLHALITGVRYRLGHYKAPYFARPTRLMYAELGVSGGFLFLVLAISSLLTRDIEVSNGVTTAVSILTYFAIVVLALNWFLGLINSNLWRPTWVIRLENHYTKTQIDQLRQQAQAMGLKEWETVTMTHNDLEAWITAVLQTENKA